MKLRAALICLALVPAPARAEDPYYFHKAGTSRETYAADVEYCAGLAGGASAPRYTAYVYSPSIAVSAAGTFIGSLFAGLAARAELRRKVSRIERTCMADKGYRRLALDKQTDREIDKLEGVARLDRMFALVAAENPTGKVLIE
jgi:hypothetical protein